MAAQREPKVVVLGGGSWGTTVASICARRGPTLQWVRSEETANDINEKHRNTKYLGGEVELALTLQATTDFSEAAESADVIVMGVPSHGFRGVLLGRCVREVAEGHAASPAASASPRCKSPQRSDGKCNPIRSAMISLTCAQGISRAALVPMSRLRVQRFIQSARFVQGEKFFQVVNQHQAVVKPDYALNVIQPRNNLRRADDFG